MANRLIDSTNALTIKVRRKAETGVTFAITTRISKPNALLASKTDCFKPDE